MILLVVDKGYTGNFSLMRMYEIYDKCVVWWSVGEFSIDGSCDIDSSHYPISLI